MNKLVDDESINPKTVNKTLKEIALEIGISTSTVSRAINRPQMVNYHTRRKIEEKMMHIGYSSKAPLNIGEQLKPTVILLVTNYFVSHHGEIVSSIIQTAQLNNLFVSVMIIEQEGMNNQAYWQIMNNKIIGIICIENNQFVEHVAHQLSIPIVLLDPMIQNLNHLRLSYDHLSASFKATEYLISLGHTQIACISGYQSNPIHHARVTGYKLALTRYEIDYSSDYLIETDLSYDAGASALRQLHKLRYKPSAYFFQSDSMAIGAIAEANKMGYRVPLDLSIIGFDNNSQAMFSSPPLTTVNVPRKEMGKQAIELILQYQLSPNSCQLNTHYDPEIIIRESCKQFLKDLD